MAIVILIYQHHKGQYDLLASQMSVSPTSITCVWLTYTYLLAERVLLLWLAYLSERVLLLRLAYLS